MVQTTDDLVLNGAVLSGYLADRLTSALKSVKELSTTVEALSEDAATARSLTRTLENVKEQLNLIAFPQGRSQPANVLDCINVIRTMFNQGKRDRESVERYQKELSVAQINIATATGALMMARDFVDKYVSPQANPVAQHDISAAITRALMEMSKPG